MGRSSSNQSAPMICPKDYGLQQVTEPSSIEEIDDGNAKDNIPLKQQGLNAENTLGRGKSMMKMHVLIMYT